MPKQTGSAFVYLLLLIIFAGAVILTAGVDPHMHVSSLSDPFDKPTIIEQAKNNAEIYTLTDKPTGTASNNQQLQLKVPQAVAQVCGQTALVIFLVDRSGSMQYNGKAQDLKAGLNTFASAFPNDGILDLTEFSDYHSEFIPLSPYSSVKAKFFSTIASFYPTGETNTANAFIYVKDYIIPIEFPQEPGNRKINLIFITDGIPESGAMDKSCNLNGNQVKTSIPVCATNCSIDPNSHTVRCFNPDQDPTTVAQALKAQGVRIFAISYPDISQFYIDKQKQMMQNVASVDPNGPNGLDYWSSPTTNGLSAIMSTITEKICNQ